MRVIKGKSHKQVALFINKRDIVLNWVTVSNSPSPFPDFPFPQSFLGFLHPAPHASTPYYCSPRLTKPPQFDSYDSFHSFTPVRNKYPLDSLDSPGSGRVARLTHSRAALLPVSFGKRSHSGGLPHQPSQNRPRLRISHCNHQDPQGSRHDGISTDFIRPNLHAYTA